MLGRGEAQIGLLGGPASGKTHLLNACARFAREHGSPLQLYDAADFAQIEPAGFDGLDSGDLLAIDNLDAIAGLAEWEAICYRLINRCRDGDCRLIYALSRRPSALPLRLEDLRSRLQWGLLLPLPDHDERSVREIMARRARLLGFELSDEVLAYLLTHHARDLRAQMAILERLDGASLSRQRRVTIPLIKQTLAEYTD